MKVGISSDERNGVFLDTAYKCGAPLRTLQIQQERCRGRYHVVLE